MRLRKYSVDSYRYILVSIAYGLMIVINAFNSNLAGVDFFSYIVGCFGGLPYSKSLDFMKMFLWVIPNIVVIYCLSTLMSDDCAINYVYVFTRLKKKNRWLTKKTLILLLNTFAIYLVLFSIATIIGLLFNLRFSSAGIKETLFSIVSMFFLNVLSIYILSYLQNFISLIYGLAQSFIMTIVFYVFSILIVIALFDKNCILNILFMCLIPVNQIYLWHENTTIVNSVPLIGFYQSFSYLFLIGISVLIYFISRVIFEKLDLVEMIKE